MPPADRAYLMPLDLAIGAGTIADSPLTEASVVMTVIDREMIRASSEVDVAALLRLVPGFQVVRCDSVSDVLTAQGLYRPTLGDTLTVHANDGGSRIETVSPDVPARGLPESSDDKMPEHTLTALVPRPLPGE